ncbi:FtsX-like permease family protein [Xylanimonas allomyrinae]|uniref:FtsX-like permease family protein n=1 Tax=Xylanimonas allomyrinae TaxID=2509459 RepID=A0A4P6EP10_9MICO|nr:FtsX-like permease family protein [Xylanimonas allomyrinae]QAY64630.1 FtsX-like permease family protein [Xylanimonas allomyrinae]
MSALVTLGLRLARAGSPLRAWSIAAGNAIGVVLLLLAGSLPQAMYPDPIERGDQRVALLTIALFLLVPAAVLLVMVGRLSSGVRDRRLASLRMIGVPPHHTRVVAAVENGVLALVGAVAGAVLFLVVLQPTSALFVRDTTVLGERLDGAPALVVAAVLLVVAVSIGAGTASTWDRALPGTAPRSEARTTNPRAWRLIVLGAGLSALAWLAGADMGTANPDLVTVAMLGGATATGVGIALVTPLVSSCVARLLVRSDGVTSRLAGRAMQADSGSASRVVAGLGVAVFLSTGALGVLGAFEAAPQNADAIRTFGSGPQKVRIMAPADGVAWEPNDLDSLLAVPGVRGLEPISLQAGPKGCPEDGTCLEVLVGTCAQLKLSFAMTGCDDTRASVISTVDADGATHPTGFLPEPPPAVGDTISLVDDDGTVAQYVTLDGPTVIQDLPRQQEEWAWPSDAVAFVPVALLGDWYAGQSFPVVVADGGSAMVRQLETWADEHGYFAWQPAEREWAKVQAFRTAVWSLCGVAITVALIVLALGAADRATERRRSVARQVMVGVPPRVLQRSQLLQTLVPVAVAVLLALGAGIVGVSGYTNMAEQASTLDSGAWLGLVLIAGVGGLLAAASTVPLVRTRLTPELLRRE